MTINKLIGMLRDMPLIIKRKNTRRKYRIIACALDSKGRVLSIKTNDYNRSHPIQKKFALKVNQPESIYLHAEISALIASKKQVHTMLVARIDNSGKPVLAKPCPICTKALHEYGVCNIIYTE